MQHMCTNHRLVGMHSCRLVLCFCHTAVFDNLQLFDLAQVIRDHVDSEPGVGLPDPLGSEQHTSWPTTSLTLAVSEAHILAFHLTFSPLASLLHPLRLCLRLLPPPTKPLPWTLSMTHS